MKIKSQTQFAQCPHCQSVFEVSQQEMQLAFGAVRCGDCLKIFNASYHRVDLPVNDQHENNTLPEQDYESELSDHNIPTLHEYRQQPDELAEAEIKYEPDPEIQYESDPDFESELVTEAREPPPPTHQSNKTTPRRLLLIAAALVLPLILLGGWLLSGTSQQNQYYLVSDIRVTAAADPQRMEIQFQLGNSGNSDLPLPNLNIELLNLSLQPIASQILTANELHSSLTFLKPGSNHPMAVIVDRPATFVQTARIHPIKPESSL
ncbi:MAG: hypothetical protein IBX50_01555 [Marinospirillum sp.]|uniref:MJ0042-type zinc finger domain-containing protein n=1 Tax=Marinospirillum sp. TaxID=2183934 RepID=UPI0019E106EB|nr:MJ0042-type zinc finger domain-containing protein [Marinospirillum sp.]MBE0505389.1 hypothetical protein [Marinospirillum sp.]